MAGRIYPTPQDAEAAFYEALERGDLEAMMSVWAEDEEDIVCIHPSGARLTGQEQVRESWRQIFARAPVMRVSITQQVTLSAAMLSVHSVHESFSLPDDPRAQGLVIATNVYVRTAAGWRMIVHHASPAPAVAEAPAGTAAGQAPKTLH
jgi:uncharacterized protein (TIGR02246 family)